MADVNVNGRPMAIGVSVDGASVAGYACNGVDDEAWFFGNQKDGSIDLTSKFRDTLKASVADSKVDGEVTMNGVTYPFTARPVEGTAGMYTAAVDNSRASWIVRPDGSVTAVQFDGGVTSQDLARSTQLDSTQFRDQLRNRRILKPADHDVRVGNGTLNSAINGVGVVAVLVTGTFRLA